MPNKFRPPANMVRFFIENGKEINILKKCNHTHLGQETRKFFMKIAKRIDLIGYKLAEIWLKYDFLKAFGGH